MRKAVVGMCVILATLGIFACDFMKPEVRVTGYVIEGPGELKVTESFGDVTYRFYHDWVAYQVAGNPVLEYTITVQPAEVSIEECEVMFEDNIPTGWNCSIEGNKVKIQSNDDEMGSLYFFVSHKNKDDPLPIQATGMITFR